MYFCIWISNTSKEYQHYILIRCHSRNQPKGRGGRNNPQRYTATGFSDLFTELTPHKESRSLFKYM